MNAYESSALGSRHTSTTPAPARSGPLLLAIAMGARTERDTCARRAARCNIFKFTHDNRHLTIIMF